MIPRLVSNRKESEFKRFQQWVGRQLEEKGPFEYVLDGANIGFFGQVSLASQLRSGALAPHIHERDFPVTTAVTPILLFFGQARDAKAREKDGGKRSKDGCFSFEQVERLPQTLYVFRGVTGRGGV